MAKRVRPPEAIKKQIAKRFHKGEDPELIASENSIAVSTVESYARMFPNNPRKVNKKIDPIAKRENTRVSKMKEENEALKKRMREIELERDMWKAQYMGVTLSN